MVFLFELTESMAKHRSKISVFKERQVYLEAYVAAISMKSQEDSKVMGSETQVFSESIRTEIKLKTTLLRELVLE